MHGRGFDYLSYLIPFLKRITFMDMLHVSSSPCDVYDWIRIQTTRPAIEAELVERVENINKQRQY